MSRKNANVSCTTCRNWNTSPEVKPCQKCDVSYSNWKEKKTMTKKKVEKKKSAWTKVEPLNLNKKKKYVVKRANGGSEPDMLVIGCDVDGDWFARAGGVDNYIDMCDIIAYIELPE